MNLTTAIAVVIALLGAAMIAGVFFAFSSFVMPALARLPAAGGISAMQSINVVVLNKSFLGLFVGTALISLLLATRSLMSWGAPSAPWLLAGALLYLLGTFLVTGVGNVPLNDQLEAVPATTPEAVAVWTRYLDRWTLLNTVRATAAGVAALVWLVGLMVSAPDA
jgi:uncharacterized membrane protein